MSGRNPPSYCTLTLIAMQGHQQKGRQTNTSSNKLLLYYTFSIIYMSSLQQLLLLKKLHGDIIIIIARRGKTLKTRLSGNDPRWSRSLLRCLYLTSPSSISPGPCQSLSRSALSITAYSTTMQLLLLLPPFRATTYQSPSTPSGRVSSVTHTLNGRFRTPSFTLVKCRQKWFPPCYVIIGDHETQ